MAFREAALPEESEVSSEDEVASAVVACVAHLRDLTSEQTRRVLRALAAIHGLEPDGVATSDDCEE